MSIEYRSVPVRKASPSRQPAPATQMIVVVQQPAAAAAPSPRSESANGVNRTPRSQAPRSAGGLAISLDNFEANPTKAVLTSPRSLHVCAQNGVHPTELIPRPLSQFMGSGVPQSIAQLRYNHYESRRQAKLEMLRSARQLYLAEPVTAVDRSAAAPETTVAARPPSPRSQTPQPISRSRPASPRSVAPAVASEKPSSTSLALALPVERVHAAIIDNQRRRADAYQRAQVLAANREVRVLEKQNMQAERCRSHLQNVHQERLVGQEVRRLHLADVKDHVQQLRRIEEYRAAVRVDNWEHKVAQRAVDRTTILAARLAYLTPRQREEKRRSQSALR